MQQLREQCSSVTVVLHVEMLSSTFCHTCVDDDLVAAAHLQQERLNTWPLQHLGMAGGGGFEWQV